MHINIDGKTKDKGGRMATDYNRSQEQTQVRKLFSLKKD